MSYRDTMQWYYLVGLLVIAAFLAVTAGCTDDRISGETRAPFTPTQCTPSEETSELAQCRSELKACHAAAGQDPGSDSDSDSSGCDNPKHKGKGKGHHCE